MIFTSKGYLNLLLATIFLFFLSRQNILNLGALAYFNHIYILICIAAFFICIIYKPVKKRFIFLSFILFAYSAFMVFRNGIPVINILQTFLTLKFVFVFFVMAYALNTDRPMLLAKFTKALTYILLFSSLFVISDYLVPNIFYTLAKDGRGIMGVTPGSFFGSRVLYSGFLLLYSILLLSFKYNNDSKRYFVYKPKVYWSLLLFAFVLLFLTFSRKELLILLVAYGITVMYKNKGLIRLLGTIALVAVAPVILAGLWFVLGDSIQANFNENYVRYKIFYYAMEIFEYNFPFGAGPGTYGTVMSKMYTDVYTFFNVDRAIIGYGSQIEGPIFDLFFVSLIAEYGLGIIFVMWFIFQPFFAEKDSYVDQVVHVRLIRINGFLMLVGIGSMVPIMGNMIGLLLFFLLGILTSNNAIFVHSRKRANA
ncbi:hypothetical protein [Vibrio parahaemolyticus]|uniref:hypothetical protein n=1 Tax=Vibrio parahaemolyticus TaxID=670 RepID=UPI0010AAD616|nr:hypothetical protein [Vibrio parahaemolyticus]MEA5182416.1 hypothetical protein [Vibrio parahaemolyticus]THE61509.1 hypothetical protein E4P16_06270 [Vibrio parahaemolyticus]HAV1350714.1 hypothetical protein [Vibrio parahaemolyticus]